MGGKWESNEWRADSILAFCCLVFAVLGQQHSSPAYAHRATPSGVEIQQDTQVLFTQRERPEVSSEWRILFWARSSMTLDPCTEVHKAMKFPQRVHSGSS